MVRTSMSDSYNQYLSRIDACGCRTPRWGEYYVVDAKILEQKKLHNLAPFDGVIVPGGFGSSGVEGKIKAIEYVRTQAIPFLGLCYGLQLAAVEFARHVCNLPERIREK